MLLSLSTTMVSFPSFLHPLDPSLTLDRWQQGAKEKRKSRESDHLTASFRSENVDAERAHRFDVAEEKKETKLREQVKKGLTQLTPPFQLLEQHYNRVMEAIDKARERAMRILPLRRTTLFLRMAAIFTRK